MCTYLTEKIELDGAGKGGSGWFTVRQGTVYVDHPYHASYAHTVNIDLSDPAAGPSARVALELTEESALALVDAIQKALASATCSCCAAVRCGCIGRERISPAAFSATGKSPGPCPRWRKAGCRCTGTG